MEIDNLKKLVSYNPSTGEFTWVNPKGWRVKRGDRAGTLLGTGYVSIGISGKKYLAHRLAWAFVHGIWPNCDVDHINQIKTDNRISNLRLASRTQNMANCGKRVTNTSGVRGVTWSKRSRKWIARVQKDGKHGYVGSYRNLDDAADAVRTAYKKSYGDFAA